MSGNTFDERIRDASVTTNSLVMRLVNASFDAGYCDLAAINEAIQWTAIQLDPEADDYETWEATLLARLENPNKEER